MNVFILLNTEGDILKNVGNRAVLGTIDFKSIFFLLLWKSMVPQNSLITNFLHNIFFCIQQNKDIHTGLDLLELRVSKLWHFLGWTTPLKEQSPLNKSSAKLFMCKSLSNGSSSNSLSCSAKANSFRCDAFTSKASKMYQEQMKCSLSNLCYFYKFMERNHALFVTYSVLLTVLAWCTSLTSVQYLHWNQGHVCYLTPSSSWMNDNEK